MLALKPIILKKEGAKQIAYYTLTWTALTLTDKYDITIAVPAVACMYELLRTIFHYAHCSKKRRFIRAEGLIPRRLRRNKGY